ncbi:MAG TPA: rhomboid family intramembrane serine protease [Anaerolineae bacterium]|nr:rhomboid family intramembrane serine protease [Anaerolineae bacterium]
MIPLRDINPTRRVPLATVALIAVNVLVFLYQQTLPEDEFQALVFRLGVMPAAVTGDFNRSAYTFVTSMFLHGDWLHVGSNMLYLWIFGNNVEDRLGLIRFVLFYFITGFAAAGAQIATAPRADIPMIGASGAIAGVLGAYLVLFPNARVQTLVFFFYFIRVIEVSAVWLLGWWFLLQVLSGFGSLAVPGMGGVAFFAHIGGFVAGYGLIRLFAASRPARRALEDDLVIPTIDDDFRPRRDRDRW